MNLKEFLGLPSSHFSFQGLLNVRRLKKKVEIGFQATLLNEKHEIKIILGVRLVLGISFKILLIFPNFIRS